MNMSFFILEGNSILCFIIILEMHLLFKFVINTKINKNTKITTNLSNQN